MATKYVLLRKIVCKHSDRILLLLTCSIKVCRHVQLGTVIDLITFGKTVWVKFQTTYTLHYHCQFYLWLCDTQYLSCHFTCFVKHDVSTADGNGNHFLFLC